MATIPTAKLPFTNRKLYQGREIVDVTGKGADVLCKAAREIAALVSCKAAQERDSDANMARALCESQSGVGEDGVRTVRFGDVIVSVSEIMCRHGSSGAVARYG
jgi:hypothetical protein